MNKKISKPKKISRVLIANRGEIAVRIIAALRELSIESVAVYSDADHDSSHRTQADMAIRLPGLTSAETYLDMDKLKQAIIASKADAVHPGYGFLSENAEFADLVGSLGAKFIGPDVKSMRLMGNKISARQLMDKHEVPMVPASKGALSSANDLKKVLDKIGYPVIIKAASGGGGRGMRVVRQESEIEEAFAGCRREAIDYFGDDAVFCERFIENPRHIEVQVLFDEHGNGVHLFERDCSIQRRHQKLIEEAPSTFLDVSQRKRLGDIAVKAGQAAGYQGAGTVEFICEAPDKAYFMEMNTRIQVEHPVTEMITGVDLIKSQIKIAGGSPLDFSQNDLKIHGWSFEARINAEDARMGFMPTPGRITKLTLPKGPFVRVDTHIKEGYEIPSQYDSMIAKVITWGRDRQEALDRMRRALSELRIEGEGVTTTTRFHETLIGHPDFVSGDFSTGFMDSCGPDVIKQMAQAHEDTDEAFLLAAVSVAAKVSKTQSPLEDTRPLWTKHARSQFGRYGQ